MPQWRNFLERFRPVGAPGAAMPQGVPADRVADVAAELAPMLELLDEVQAEAERIRRDGVEQAARLRYDGEEQAAAMVERARTRGKIIEAEAFARAHAEFAAQQADFDSEHAMEIERLRARIAARMPEFVDRVLAQAQILIAELSGPVESSGRAERRAVGG